MTTKSPTDLAQDARAQAHDIRTSYGYARETEQGILHTSAALLDTLAALLAAHPCQGPPLFLACSALKNSYRQTLRAAAPARVRFFFLNAPPELIEQRLQERHTRGRHFMPPDLLASQFASLENPDDSIPVVDVSRPPDTLAADILKTLTIPH